MAKIEDLRIGQTVRYNGKTVCQVYSLIGAAPYEDERFANKPMIELFDGGGLFNALEEEVEPAGLVVVYKGKSYVVKSVKLSADAPYVSYGIETSPNAIEFIPIEGFENIIGEAQMKLGDDVI